LLDQTTISPSQVRFIHDFFGEIIFLKRLRWPGAALREPLIRYVKRDGITMRMLSRSKRTAKFLLTAPYLLAGRYVFNRQARVFKNRPSGRTALVRGPVALNRPSWLGVSSRSRCDY
jgi:hypothetical protein